MNVSRILNSAFQKQKWLNVVHDIVYVNRRHFSSNVSSESIRQQFTQYYIKQHAHLYVHSSPIILHNDKSLLFVNAGMNQFKCVLLDSIPKGNPLSNYKRVVNSQKCIRVGGKHNDLDEVGNDLYHHTFFEMLGTWSFDDYQKEEACTMAWKLLTEIYKIPPGRLYVTYFGGNEALKLEADEECFDIWKRIGVPENRILPHGMKDNFWEMDLTGPCGPCTEIHYDHIGNRHVGHLVNTGDPLVTELWNLVFIQFERKNEQCLEKLTKQHIDCGMGFERLVAVLQGKHSNYDTDLFVPILKKIESLSGMKPYSGCVGKSDPGGVDAAYRKIADHIRMITVAMVDGVLPDSKNHGNVLRRMIRNTIQIAFEKLKMKKFSIAELVPVFMDTLRSAYPEFEGQEQNVMSVINAEEKKFYRSLKIGNNLINKIISELNYSTVFPGKKAWEIEFTLGYPMSKLKAVLASQGMTINWHEYEKEIEMQKERKKTSQSNLRIPFHKPDFDYKRAIKLLKQQTIAETVDNHKYSYVDSSLNGYGTLTTEVAAIFKHGEIVKSVAAGDLCTLVLKETLFYAEKDGQVCDKGTISTDVCNIQISSVKEGSNYVFHHGKVKDGVLSCCDNVIASINKDFRLSSMRNHTAMHLLNYSIESVLWPSVEVSSRIYPDFLSFTFQSQCLYQKGLSNDDLCSIETKVNEKIKESAEIKQSLSSSSSEALLKENITFVPGTIYPNLVNVVHIGNFSSEICSGTHVKNTADIQHFAILSSKSISQMQKTIKAVSGTKALGIKKNYEELRMQLADINPLMDEIEQSNNYQVASELNSLCVNHFKDVRKKINLMDLSYSDEKNIQLEFQESKSKFDEIYNRKLLPSLLIKVDNETPSTSLSLPYLVHNLCVEGNDDLLPAYVLTKYYKIPVMVFSKSTDSSMFWCHCSIPRDYIDMGCDAQEWGNYVKGFMKGSRKPVIQNPEQFICKTPLPVDFEKSHKLSCKFAEKKFK